MYVGKEFPPFSVLGTSSCIRWPMMEGGKKMWHDTKWDGDWSEAEEYPGRGDLMKVQYPSFVKWVRKYSVNNDVWSGTMWKEMRRKEVLHVAWTEQVGNAWEMNSERHSHRLERLAEKVDTLPEHNSLVMVQKWTQRDSHKRLERLAEKVEALPEREQDEIKGGRGVYCDVWVYAQEFREVKYGREIGAHSKKPGSAQWGRNPELRERPCINDRNEKLAHTQFSP